MNDPRYQKIIAHQAHEIDGTPHAAIEDRPINQKEKETPHGTPYTLLWIGWQCIYVFKGKIKTRFGVMNTPRDIKRAMRLLERAEQLMTRDGQGGAK